MQIFNLFGKSSTAVLLSGAVVIAVILAVGAYLNSTFLMEYFYGGYEGFEVGKACEADAECGEGLMCKDKVCVAKDGFEDMEEEAAEGADAKNGEETKEGFYGDAAGTRMAGQADVSGDRQRAADLQAQHATRMESALSGSVPAGVDPMAPVYSSVGAQDDLTGANMAEAGMSNNLKPHSFPKAQLNPSELLPNEDVESQWARAHPKAQGELEGKNFLEAGHHVGLNTVGSSLRNANLSVRSEPPNPQMNVSVWNQTTIQPDIVRRGFEIGN